ncbi:hypothetical protein ABZ858_20285 [Streptomyces sp. NPDC047017]|uniref:hypothetical protein n=1 Tax=Streptomyces sp. NPDC047017 TaxID=3155024 RepID=UPI003402E104
MTMVLSTTLGRNVIDVGDARRLGTVQSLVVDARRTRITALRLHGAKSGAGLIAWADLQAVGPDAVIVDAARTTPVTVTDREEEELLGKRLLTELGEDIGTLDDLSFHPDSGLIHTLFTSHGHQLAGSRLLGAGSYAVVVRGLPPEAPKAPEVRETSPR